MPNLGYETIGGTTRVLNGSIRGLKGTVSVSAAMGVTITAYIEDAAPGDSFRAALIDDADDETVLAVSDIRTDISAAGWYTFSGGSLATYTPANGETFTFAVASNSAAGANMYHDGAGASAFDGYAGGISSIDPLTLVGPLALDASRDYSIYLTYTVTGGRRFFLNC